jgi:hypothetical protein
MTTTSDTKTPDAGTAANPTVAVAATASPHVAPSAQDAATEPAAPSSEAVDTEAPGQTLSTPMPLWMVIASAALVSILVTILGQIAYAHYGPKAVRIATVDINEVMQIKEVQLTVMASKPGVTDKEREAAYDEITKFGSSFEGAIGELQRDCDCLILVRAAVVKGAEDMTGALKLKLGMGEVTLAQALATLSSPRPQAATPAAPGTPGGTSAEAARASANLFATNPKAKP